MDLNVWKIFSGVAAEVADRPAVFWRDRQISYGQLLERATRLAQFLRTHGFGLHTLRSRLERWEIGQDTVGLYLLNGPEFVEVQLGGFAARMAPFNVNYRYVADELAHLLRNADPSALVFHARFAPTVADVVPSLKRLPLLMQVSDDSNLPLLPGAIDYEAALDAADPIPLSCDQHPDDIQLLYTGGTTGSPKGALWRQGDFWSAILSEGPDDNADLEEVIAAAGARRPVRILPSAPFMHGGALCTALRALLAGDTVAIAGTVERLDPADVWTTVGHCAVDRLQMVGEAMARPLLAELAEHPYDVSSLKLVLTGGAPMTPATKQRLLHALPHCAIVDGAGATEAGTGLIQLSTSGGPPPEAGIFKPGRGWAVLDDNGAPLPPGHPGTGWVARSGHVPLGYLGDPKTTLRTFPVIDGMRWGIPGDIARLRDDGSVELLGRGSGVINSGGEKIFAEEVERVLLAHPAVADAVVIGRPSDRWGEEVVAIIEVRPTAEVSDDELLLAAGNQIARFKLPKAIIRVDRMVRGPAGKSDLRWARQLAHVPEHLQPAGTVPNA